jgi:hypothetical protein
MYYEVKRQVAVLAPTLVIHGGARGVDSMAGAAAAQLKIPIRVFPADWKKNGKAAGPIRNQQMLDEGKPDLVLAFWDGKSRGTEHMIGLAKKAGILCRVVQRGPSGGDWEIM